MNKLESHILQTVFDYYVHKRVTREEALKSIISFKRVEVYALRAFRYKRNQYKVILPEKHYEKRAWFLYIRSETAKGKTTRDIASDLKMTLANINHYLL